jgi:uncharacterized membrane protein YdcZ (DUF606 family)
MKEIGGILAVIYVAALIMLLSLMGCTTTKAKVEAYGAHIISPYGVMSLGWIKYEREADPESAR